MPTNAPATLTLPATAVVALLRIGARATMTRDEWRVFDAIDRDVAAALKAAQEPQGDAETPAT